MDCSRRDVARHGGWKRVLMYDHTEAAGLRGGDESAGDDRLKNVRSDAYPPDSQVFIAEHEIGAGFRARGHFAGRT